MPTAWPPSWPHAKGSSVNHVDQLAALRHGIAATKAELACFAVPAARNQEHARADIKAFAESASAIGRQRLGYAVVADTLQDAFMVRETAPGRLDMAPLLAAVLGPKAFAAALTLHVDQLPPAPDPTDHRDAVAALEADLLAAEVEEERLVDDAEAQGLRIGRRSDARPDIVLGVIT